MNPETEIGGAARAFPATSWTLLEQARQDHAAGGGAGFERLVRLYWKPVYWFIRRSSPASNEDAKDLAQDFFTRIILGGALVERFDPRRGAFRPFLKTSLRNFLAQVRRDEGAQKRGGDVAVLSMNALGSDAVDILPEADALGPEEAFDLAWRRSVLARSLERLEARLRASGKELYWEVFRRYEIAESGAAPSYAEVGAALGLPVDTVKNYLTVARRSFLEVAKEIVYLEVDRREDFAQEISALFRT
jgi:RNA polymerase sigma factor (sigma-70 family)